ncbi:T9SS type A sorting domain-containing protein [Aquirufa lenticrescens]|uniref:T9SS type A sorting domain-containing protein n=1 Tax=Aquirufa lenticrescens TaxID=2696560 RepID=UPI001CAA5B8B|nr:T9SS type A sorting domain-containing protein [Aquirufa lenticrescens]UAJ13598.1 T9SS type A sorting domain-containing protein [Aquirufa lenticrescens]
MNKYVYIVLMCFLANNLYSLELSTINSDFKKGKSVLFQSKGNVLEELYRNKQNHEAADFLKTINNKGLFVANNDVDNDGIADNLDNCKYLYNPSQLDINSDGIGDICTLGKGILKSSISELADKKIGDSISLKDIIPDSVFQKYSVDLSLTKSLFKLKGKSLVYLKSFSELDSDLVQIPITLKISESVKTIDTLTIRRIDYVNWPKNTAKIQNGYIPYYYNSLTQQVLSPFNKQRVGVSQFFPMRNSNDFLYLDLNKDGNLDIVGNTQQFNLPLQNKNVFMGGLLIPIYLLIDKEFNIKSYSENSAHPDILFHNTDYYSVEDLDGDGWKEFIPFGEHYHAPVIDGDSASKKQQEDILKKLGFLKNRDFNSWGAKIQRSYKVVNGRLVDNYKKIVTTPATNKFFSFMGHASGDIDNDGDVDFLFSGGSENGEVLGVSLNTGNDSLKTKTVQTNGYSTSPEGPNLLIDMDNDGYKDYFFSGQIYDQATNKFKTGYLGYIKNRGNGEFDVQNPVFYNQFANIELSSKNIFELDLNKDGKKEIVVFRSRGLGSINPGLDTSKISSQILVLEVKGDGTIIDKTTTYFDKNTTSKTLSGSNWLFYEDIDGDKIKDFFPYYFADTTFANYFKEYTLFNGYWEKANANTVYFKGDALGNFKFTNLGNFKFTDEMPYFGRENSERIGNRMFPKDLNGDGTAELLVAPHIGINLIIFKLATAKEKLCSNATKPIINTSKFTFCASDTLKLSITNSVKKDKYKWYFGSQVDSTNVTSKGFVDSYKVLIVKTDSLGCESKSDTLVLTKLATITTPTITATTPLIFCAGQNVVLTSNGANNQWYINGSAIANATMATYSANVSGTYKVKSISGECSSLLSSAVNVVVNPTPNVPLISNSTSLAFCSGQNVVLTSNGPNNQWYQDGNIISNANSSTFTATGSGVYKVRASLGDCVSELSAGVSVLVTTTPATPTITATTPLTFCAGQNVVLTSNGASNQWYLNDKLITNATAATYTANAAGTYKVKAISGDCSSPLSAASNVVVNPIPAIPTITMEANGGLTSSASDGNQWYFNDVKIDNATQKTINPTKSGNYTVKVVTPCASEISKPYNLVVTSTEETILGQVSVSPNPVTGEFKVSFPVEFGKTAMVKIVDMSGNVQFKKASVNDGERIDVRNLNGGNYILHLQSNDNANVKAIKVSKIL